MSNICLKFSPYIIVICGNIEERIFADTWRQAMVRFRTWWRYFRTMPWPTLNLVAVGVESVYFSGRCETTLSFSTLVFVAHLFAKRSTVLLLINDPTYQYISYIQHINPRWCLLIIRYVFHATFAYGLHNRLKLVIKSLIPNSSNSESHQR